MWVDGALIGALLGGARVFNWPLRFIGERRTAGPGKVTQSCESERGSRDASWQFGSCLDGKAWQAAPGGWPERSIEQLLEQSA